MPHQSFPLMRTKVDRTLLATSLVVVAKGTQTCVVQTQKEQLYLDTVVPWTFLPVKCICWSDLFQKGTSQFRLWYVVPHHAVRQNIMIEGQIE